MNGHCSGACSRLKFSSCGLLLDSGEVYSEDGRKHYLTLKIVPEVAWIYIKKDRTNIRLETVDHKK